MSKSHLTAIKRKQPSLPARRLASDNRIIGRALDYGCGKGFDAKYYDMESYDPYYQPEFPEGTFETILCSYVLNVIESPEARLHTLWEIQGLLTGIAYVTVRNDRRALKGTTSKGTWQGLITLALPVVYRCSGYVTYELRRSDDVGRETQNVYLTSH